MPIQLLQPGEATRLFDVNTLAAPQTSAVFALPAMVSRVISWSYSFDTSNPSAVSVNLEMSVDGVSWTVLDTGTVATGETKNTAVSAAGFLRANKVTQTGGGGLNLTVIFGN
jgi:hypothetical protein